MQLGIFYLIETHSKNIKKHIENAIFFDLEKNSNQQKNLPHDHFLPKKKDWEVVSTFKNGNLK